MIPNVNALDDLELRLDRLSDDEKRLFALICRSYLAAVMPDYEFRQTVVTMSVPVTGGSAAEFRAIGRIPLKLGWKAAYGAMMPDENKENDAEQTLPVLTNGEAATLSDPKVEAKRTQPPPRFSEGTLVEAMQNAWRFVEAPELRARLKEAKGIGTPATRAEIIKGLKRQDLLTADGKFVIPTSGGLQIFELLRQVAPGLVDPATTASWEMRLEDIVAGRGDFRSVIDRFFTLIGEGLAKQIQFVCSDMWRPYLNVIAERCRQAIHILDRFHIVAKMSAALNDVRAAEARRLARDGYEPILKKSRWCVLKRKGNLTEHQRFRLRDLLRYNLRTVRAYLLKEDFQQLWEYESPTWAGKFLDEWCRQVMRSRIEPMKKIARSLRSHRTLILNYFHAKKQFSSGIVEGLNNKAKLTMRKSYGFRTFHVLETALYHALGKLPEPDVAHKFFSIAMLKFLRNDVPRNWRTYCDEVTDNFRVIDPKKFRNRVSRV